MKKKFKYLSMQILKKKLCNFFCILMVRNMLEDHYKVFRVCSWSIEPLGEVVDNAVDFGWQIKGLNIRVISKSQIRKLFILTSSFHPHIVF